MRVGSLVYVTEQGLGYLAKDFYDNGIVTDVVIVRHRSRPEFPEWYPEGTPFPDSIWSADGMHVVREFCKDMDAMLFFETPFDWGAITHCREMGTPTFLMPMYECTPVTLPALPDYLLCPSDLDHWEFTKDPPIPAERILKVQVPIDKGAVVAKSRPYAKTFVHNAGHGGLKGRNGTREFLQSLRHVKSRADFIIRSQESIPDFWEVIGDKGNWNSVRYDVGTCDRGSLYAEGDVFVFPEKFNGLSLPLQEACASGMLVMTTDRFPNNEYLPTEPLIPTMGYVRNRISPRFRQFDEAIVKPEDIAAKIDEWYGRNILDYSDNGLHWGQLNSWENLKQGYLDILSAGRSHPV